MGRSPTLNRQWSLLSVSERMCGRGIDLPPSLAWARRSGMEGPHIATVLQMKKIKRTEDQDPRDHTSTIVSVSTQLLA